NDADHGIQAVKPPPALWDERAGIGNRGGEHPALDDEGHDILYVAIESVERGHPEADTEGGEHGKKQQHGQPKRGERRLNAVDGGDHKEEDEPDGEVHKPRNDGGNWEYKPWEINFGDDVLIGHDNAGAALERGGEVGPGNKRREIENGI